MSTDEDADSWTLRSARVVGTRPHPHPRRQPEQVYLIELVEARERVVYVDGLPSSYSEQRTRSALVSRERAHELGAFKRASASAQEHEASWAESPTKK